jgi:DNA-binding response OmpR family regulator
MQKSAFQKTKKHRVLIVEDESSLLSLYVQLLEEEGFIVSSASEGKTGLELLKNGGFDLVLLDIMLPYIDGLNILEQLKESPPSAENKVIVLLTNLAQDESLARGMQLGIDGYLVKSDYNPDEFISEVKKFLQIADSKLPL